MRFKISEGVFLSDNKVCMGTGEWVTEGYKMNEVTGVKAKEV